MHWACLWVIYGELNHLYILFLDQSDQSNPKRRQWQQHFRGMWNYQKTCQRRKIGFWGHPKQTPCCQHRGKVSYFFPFFIKFYFFIQTNEIFFSLPKVFGKKIIGGNFAGLCSKIEKIYSKALRCTFFGKHCKCLQTNDIQTNV